jgi:hypothetical protein
MRRLQDRTERPGQPVHVSFEAGMRNLDILPACEAPQALWQITGLRHQGAIDEDRDHANTALKRSLDLDSNKIIGVVDAPPIVLVRGNPIPPDDRDERVASGDAFVQGIEPIDTGVDIVDIEKDVLAPHLLRDPIVNRARGESRLFASIANKDAA